MFQNPFLIRIHYLSKLHRKERLVVFNDTLVIFIIFFHVWAYLKLFFELGSKACVDEVMGFSV
jgi:hypothetical protein